MVVQEVFLGCLQSLHAFFSLPVIHCERASREGGPVLWRPARSGSVPRGSGGDVEPRTWLEPASPASGVPEDPPPCLTAHRLAPLD